MFSKKDQEGIDLRVVQPLDTHLRDIFVQENIEQRLMNRPHAGWTLHRGDGEIILYALNINDALLGLKILKTHPIADVGPETRTRTVIVRADESGEHYFPYEEIIFGPPIEERK